MVASLQPEAQHDPGVVVAPAARGCGGTRSSSVPSHRARSGTRPRRPRPPSISASSCGSTAGSWERSASIWHDDVVALVERMAEAVTVGGTEACLAGSVQHLDPAELRSDLLGDAPRCRQGCCRRRRGRRSSGSTARTARSRRLDVLGLLVGRDDHHRGHPQQYRRGRRPGCHAEAIRRARRAPPGSSADAFAAPEKAKVPASSTGQNCSSTTWFGASDRDLGGVVGFVPAGPGVGEDEPVGGRHLLAPGRCRRASAIPGSISM